MSARALEAIDRILGRSADADDVLRSIVAELAREPGVDWAGIFFLEDGEPALGPQAGVADESRRVRVPVTYRDMQVGELAIDGRADAAVLEHVAAAISAHVLLGWDTGGEAWEP